VAPAGTKLGAKVPAEFKSRYYPLRHPPPAYLFIQLSTAPHPYLSLILSLSHSFSPPGRSLRGGVRRRTGRPAAWGGARSLPDAEVRGRAPPDCGSGGAHGRRRRLPVCRPRGPSPAAREQGAARGGRGGRQGAGGRAGARKPPGTKGAVPLTTMGAQGGFMLCFIFYSCETLTCSCEVCEICN